MKLVSRHVDGSLHRTWTNVCRTDHAWAFYIPPGAAVEEADGRQWSSPYPVIAQFFPGRYYQVFLLFKPEGTEYYCNVITPPVLEAHGDTVAFYDLDLDVYVSQRGPEILDEEEFQARKGGYPQHWVQSAEAARDELVSLARAGAGVFSPATSHRWRAWLHSRRG